MKISVGHAVEGENFFGRDKELKRMKNIWTDEAASIFIPGPRRIGKTSLVKEFIRSNKNVFKFIYFDLEGRYSIAELCKDLTKKIASQYPELVKSTGSLKDIWNVVADMFSELEVGGLVKIKVSDIQRPTKEITDKMEDLFKSLYDQKFIFAFDEFSDFLLNLKKKNEDEVTVKLVVCHSFFRGFRF